MKEPTQYRNRQVAFTPEERKQYKAEADRIDREEKSSIIDQARRAKARAGMLRDVLHKLRDEREHRGLSLAEISRRSGIDKGALSRLENAVNANPKFDTLVRYADALGVELAMTVTAK